MDSRSTAKSKCALVLLGGGARCAYQVGVLRGIAEILGEPVANPFPILTGTSAGAVIGSILACGADNFSLATKQLEGFWSHFESRKVYRTDSAATLKAVAQMLLALLSAGRLAQAPSALFDTSPLRIVLEGQLNFARMRMVMAAGKLEALALTATDLLSGDSVTFFETLLATSEWSRAWRRGEASRLSITHLMASTAMPLLFPGVRIADSIFGDGAVRQLTPLSPAVHLGADRIFAISVRENARGSTALPGMRQSASPAQILGLALDTLFLDTLDADLERLERVNQFLASNTAQPSEYHGIEALVLRPSVDITKIAAELIDSLPRSTRTLLRLLGAGRGDGGRLGSYLLFEAEFTRALIAAGRADAHDNQSAIVHFLRPDI